MDDGVGKSGGHVVYDGYVVGWGRRVYCYCVVIC